MTTGHTQLASGRWNSMSLADQMGNIGSEFQRAARFLEREDHARREAATERVMELVGLTLADSRWKASRHEIVLLREIVSDYLTGSEVNQLTRDQLVQYFTQFALYARRESKS